LFANRVTVDVRAVPCKSPVEGDVEHVELGGTPPQDRAIAPVMPPIGVMVTL
jgi:hypothetical protein